MKKLLSSLLLTFLVFFTVIGSVDPAFAQTIKRKTVIEDFTGTWCKWCTFADTVIDEARAELGDSLVVLKWHYDDDLSIDEGRLLSEDFSVVSYPSALINRRILLGNNPEALSNPWLASAREDAQQDPVISIKIANYIFKDYSHRFRIILDQLMPAEHMPSSDTSEFVILAVITEDSIVHPQRDMQDNTISDYVHNDVVRALPMNQLGELVTLNAGGSFLQSFEIKHDLNWRDDKLQVKAFVAIRNKETNTYYILNADETSYLQPTLSVNDHPDNGIVFDVVQNTAGGVKLHYQNSASTDARITIHDVLGNEIRTVSLDSHNEQAIRLDELGLRPGSYFARLAAGGRQFVRPFQLTY